MEYLVKRKGDFVCTNWGGGSTTELFIFPPYSSYKARDFEFRISTATVQKSPSDFTILDGYLRLLMPISDSLRLEFADGGVRDLLPFDVVAFDGGIGTVSYGVCTDIGIMFRAKWDCEMFLAKSQIAISHDGFCAIFALSNTQIRLINSPVNCNSNNPSPNSFSNAITNTPNETISYTTTYTPNDAIVTTTTNTPSETINLSAGDFFITKTDSNSNIHLPSPNSSIVILAK